MTNMVKWLKEYEQYRTNPFSKNDSWESTKYDINGLYWKDIATIVLEDLPDQYGVPMTWGQACSALKQSWYHYKMLSIEGGPKGDIAWRINNIQDAMGIPVTAFDDEEDDNFGDWEGL